MIPTLECKQFIVVVVSHRLVIGPVQRFDNRFAGAFIFNSIDRRDAGLRIVGVVVRGLSRGVHIRDFTIRGRCRQNVAWQLDKVLGNACFRGIDLDQNDIGRRDVIRLIFFVQIRRSCKFILCDVGRHLDTRGVCIFCCCVRRFNDQDRVAARALCPDFGSLGDRWNIHEIQFWGVAGNNFRGG
ncbi:hypothetical protein Poly24_34820 [Rosistilla carotiformis]|uniref:Uncharacterized protein n=1 Tax=Rosistilla carotiformis TaxID=2528017 RepID=A0A518JW45_9BACT|nr:hypothetical protein Poly24_34820 [Rosistilla carotiformis]